jgi:hypothetical protein
LIPIQGFFIAFAYAFTIVEHQTQIVLRPVFAFFGS